MSSELKDPRFHARLTELIGDEHPYSWAGRVGISKGAFSRIWNEGTVPGPDHLRRIREATGISIDWLLTGEGEKLSSSGIDQVNGELIKLIEGKNIDIEKLFIKSVEYVALYMEFWQKELPPEILSRIYLQVFRLSVVENEVSPRTLKSVIEEYSNDYFVPSRDKEVSEKRRILAKLSSVVNKEDRRYFDILFKNKFGEYAGLYMIESKDEMLKWFDQEITECRKKQENQRS